MTKYFDFSIIFSVICLIIGYIIGGIQGVFICGILGILEISLSFDNAIVNAKVLDGMDEIWRKRFLTWGIMIAVFGMRLLFPLLIVGITANLLPLDALQLAISSPKEYQHILESSHTMIMGYGGAFLFLVGLKYFIDKEKDVHWIHFIENTLSKFGNLESIQIVITLLLSVITSRYIISSEQIPFLLSVIFGIITYILVEALGDILGDDSNTLKKGGIGAFLYLELLDISFSFDGVISSFSITNNIFIIMLGLGIGAIWVRSITLMLVDKGTIAEYKYLEHGAFWSILILAGIMYVNTITEISEVITGLIGVTFIIAAFISSIIFNKKAFDV